MEDRVFKGNQRIVGLGGPELHHYYKFTLWQGNRQGRRMKGSYFIEKKQIFFEKSCEILLFPLLFSIILMVGFTDIMRSIGQREVWGPSLGDLGEER